jgi:hypothetical protein
MVKNKILKIFSGVEEMNETKLNSAAGAMGGAGS